ncbi:ATP-binding protein [Candidatus Woesearchaeota archaeon]|nr:ATP-binding protein [Candidatus Woesearchaeota archaeon]
MSSEFYNRKDEMRLLQQKYSSLSKGVLLVVYGRRRVGKTELIKEFMKKCTAKKLYIYVDLSSKQEILNSFSLAILEQLGESRRFGTFDQLFDFFDEMPDRSIIAFDEFQRFLNVAPEFVTKLQNRWDSSLKNKKIMMLLVGSSIGMMQRLIQGRAGALYGRATPIKISPFRYVDFRLMFTNLSEEQRVERFAVFGGTPHYLEKTKPFKTTLDAISALVLKKGGELSEEPKLLMEYENMRVHATYNSILHAIASGKEILKKMQDFTKIPSNSLMPYVQKLDLLLDLVGKHDPLLGKERLGRYAIRDNFFKFWYRFVFSNQTALQLGNDKLVLTAIEQDLNSYVGHIFEDIIKEFLILHLHSKIKGIDINFDAIGNWWDRNGNEIDIVATNHKDKKVLVGEVKWNNKPIDAAVAYELIEKAKLLPFHGQYTYLIVSKAGFTEKCVSAMKSLNITPITLQEVEICFNKLQ